MYVAIHSYLIFFRAPYLHSKSTGIEIGPTPQAVAIVLLSHSSSCAGRDQIRNCPTSRLSRPPLPISNRNPISTPFCRISDPPPPPSPLPRRRKSTSGSSISAMHLDGVDDELGGGSCAPSPARFELQEDPSFWKDNNVQVEFYPPQCELPPPLPLSHRFSPLAGVL